MDEKTSRFLKYLDWLDGNSDFARPARKTPPPPVHPGIVLLEQYLKPKGLTQQALSRDIGCTYAKVNEIVHGKRGITASFALDLERVLGLPAETWLSLQMQYDLWQARTRGVRK